jgi:hypothetical protein
MKAVSITSKKEQQDFIRPRLRKTKICSFFQEGRCRRGDACGFAHSLFELEASPDLTKTSICLAWKEGSCPHSAAQCNFAHGKHDLRAFPSSKSSDESKDAGANLLALPPGLLPPPSPLLSEIIDKSPASRITDFQPMKVFSPKESETSADLMPVKITSGGLSPWTHWESETATSLDAISLDASGESSSDDDCKPSARLQSQAALCLGSEGNADYDKEKVDELLKSMFAAALVDSDAGAWPFMHPEKLDFSMFGNGSDYFFNNFDQLAAMGGAPLYSPMGGYGFPSSQLSDYAETGGFVPWTTEDYSLLGGVPSGAEP